MRCHHIDTNLFWCDMKAHHGFLLISYHTGVSPSAITGKFIIISQSGLSYHVIHTHKEDLDEV